MATSRTVGRLTGIPPATELHGRHLARVTATVVANIAAFMVLFQLYKLVRKSFILRGESVGFVHAEQIIDLQRKLHLFFEPDLQRWVMGHEWLIRGLNWYYAGFMWTFYACCAIAIALAPERFRHLRRVFVLSMLLALPWYAIYPLAPPRFMPGYGFLDTLKIFGPNYFSNEGLVAANQFAAMPSMHIGWTTIGAFMLAAAIPNRRIGAVLGIVHVSMMTLTVMATGNHYVLDIVGGWAIVAAAFAIAHLLPAPLPLPWTHSAAKPVEAHHAPLAQARPAQRRAGVER